MRNVTRDDAITIVNVPYKGERYILKGISLKPTTMGKETEVSLREKGQRFSEDSLLREKQTESRR